jgi:pimeloyl-ACP methyl ester carboxylesterase
MGVRSIRLLVSVCAVLIASQAWAIPVPPQPTDPKHPGSTSEPFGVSAVNLNGATLFLPTTRQPARIPVVVFGHGHDVPMFAYQRTFEHLAGKGIAVIYPDYGSGGDFGQMGQTYAQVADAVVRQYSQIIDPELVVFAGHSNGSRVALIAAAVASNTRNMVMPRSLVLFETAGFDPDYLTRIHPDVAITLAVGEGDTKTPPAHSEKIYQALSVKRKQFILVRNYPMTNPQIVSDHGYPRTFDWTGARVNPLHYYGVWKFLIGAAWDLQSGGLLTNPYLYGDQAQTTGVAGLSHQVLRNW